MDWETDLSDSAKQTMQMLGSFGPTVNAANREVKGYTIDENGDGGKAYYTSSCLREMSKAMAEVADWLDERAALAKDGA